MARTAKAVSQMVRRTGFDPTGAFSAIDVANGLSITAAGSGRSGTIVLVVRNTAGTAKIVTVRGANGFQDLPVSVPATTGERWIHLDDDAAYEQAGEAFHVDFETGMTGTIAVVRLP